MKTQELIDTVRRELAGASETYLQEIIDHGIHNLTNDFQGENDGEYEAFTEEFDKQARAGLVGNIE